jgi:hypothetical protein
VRAIRLRVLRGLTVEVLRTRSVRVGHSLVETGEGEGEGEKGFARGRPRSSLSSMEAGEYQHLFGIPETRIEP